MANSKLACASLRTCTRIKHGFSALCWIKDGEGNTGNTHKKKTLWLLTRKGFQMGHEREDLDIMSFLSTIHVFIIPYLLNTYFMSSTNSQRRGHSSEQAMALPLSWSLGAIGTPGFQANSHLPLSSAHQGGGSPSGIFTNLKTLEHGFRPSLFIISNTLK